MQRIATSLLAGAVCAAVAIAGPAGATDVTGTCVTPSLTGATPQGQVCISPKEPFAEDYANAKTVADKQLAVYNWAWNTFISLSWPSSDKRGEPDVGKPISAPGARVWETYKTTAETYTTPPQRPTSWDAPSVSTPPAGCPVPAAGKPAPRMALVRANKTDDPALSAVVQPMSGKFGHLIDQNGNYVYIDVMTNKQSYNFVFDNQYYDANVQARATQAQMSFPSGDNATSTPAAINVKPSWKIIAGNDNPAKFYTREAYVINPDTSKCTIETVGLVGFHITAKTVTSPQWVWTTFEHKSNAPDCAYPNGQAKGCAPVVQPDVQYNFFNKNCTTNCELNKLPTPATMTTPVQVARIVPISDPIKQYNAQIQALLAGTVWENYIMVDSQFPVTPTQSIYGNPFPTVLANTTLETYSQGESPLTQTSSCLGCHLPAPTTANPVGSVFADFDWQMHKAQPFPAAAAK